MAYRFKLDEPFVKGVRRIGLEQIERAEHHLTAAGDKVLAVHETRKCVKRVRALLRLVRPALGEKTFRAENAKLRNIAALLSGTRDNHVMLESITKLETRFGLEPKGPTAAVRTALTKHAALPGTSLDKTGIVKAVALLRGKAKRFARLKLEFGGFDAVGEGAERTYRTGRRAFAAAYARPSDETFHEWRKAVQQHWRHMGLLSNAWPDYFAARVGAARELSQILGDDHDLALLISFVRGRAAKEIRATDARQIVRLAHQRQRELRAEARPRGERLYAEGAKGLRRRIAIYWETAARLADAEPAPKRRA